MKDILKNKNYIFLLTNFLFFIIIAYQLHNHEINRNIFLIYLISSLILNFFALFREYFYLISIYFLISYLLLIYYRSPEIFIYGRFFAEEGSVHWAYSLVNNFGDILQHVVPIAGYYTFNVNLTMIFIKLLPKTISPFITMYSSLLISIIPAILAYVYNIFNLNKIEKNYIFGLFIFLHSLNWPEIALNTINSQVYLGVIVFMIFSFGLNSKNVVLKIFEQFILVFSFLSTFYAAIQFPIIFIRYLQNKTKYLFLTLTVALLTSSFQSIVFFFSKLENILFSKKADTLPEFSYVLSVLFSSFSLNFVSTKYWSLSYIGISILLFVFYMLGSQKKEIINKLIVLNLILQLILVTYGQGGDYFAERYAVVLPTIAATLTLLLISQKFTKHFFWVLLIVFLINSISFVQHSSDYADRFFSCQDSCYSWSEQLDMDLIEHWPIGDTWITNMQDPKPTPSIKQISSFNFDYEKYYNYKLVNLFKTFILTLNN